MSETTPDAIGDPERLEALKQTGLLDTAPEASFDRFAQLAVDLLEVRAALIALVGTERQFIKSSAGLEHLGVTEEHQELPLSHSFGQLVVTSEAPVVVSNAREDDRLQDTLDVDELGILAYAAFPLRTTEGGHILGSFCALNDAPHDWTEKELDILEGLADAIVAHIELQEAKEEAEQAQEEAESARRRAEFANEAKNRFVANMSHELRTPLNSVIGYSEMFMDDPLSWDEDRLKDGLRRIHHSGEQLLELINDVLNLSKAEAGRLGLSLSTFEIGPLVEQVVEEVRPIMKENDNEFDVRGLDEVGEVCSDESKIRQILSNLLSNAAKYTQQGTVTLEVSMRDTDAQMAKEQEQMEDESCEPYAMRRELVFEVSDTGIGMTEEEQEKIFEAFERAANTDKSGGTGLGLGIVQNLCNVLGGGVEVESEKGEGSCFTAYIPVRAPGEIGNEAGGSALKSGDTPHPPLGAMPPQRDDLVLVIDDDRNARILMRNHLEEAGFKVETASGGREGLEQARELHPMAIILDVLMDGMDGWEVLTRLKENPDLQHIPVVMASITHDEGRGFRLGAAEHLVKPVDRDRLTGLLEQHRGDTDSFAVLVVEDDKATRDVVQQVIEDAKGYEFHEAENGRKALDLLNEGLAPNLVLLDLMMPEMNGFEFLEATRDHLRDVPIIVLTAKDLTDEDVGRLNGQVEQIIRKEDYSREEMLHEIQQHVKALRNGATEASTSES